MIYQGSELWAESHLPSGPFHKVTGTAEFLLLSDLKYQPIFFFAGETQAEYALYVHDEKMVLLAPIRLGIL